MCLLEGRLYPVNERAARTISNLYAGNERVSLMIDNSSCHFQCFPDDIFIIIDFIICKGRGYSENYTFKLQFLYTWPPLCQTKRFTRVT